MYQTFEDAQTLASEYTTCQALDIMFSKHDELTPKFRQFLRKTAEECYGDSQCDAHVLYSSYVQTISAWHTLDN